MQEALFVDRDGRNLPTHIGMSHMSTKALRFVLVAVMAADGCTNTPKDVIDEIALAVERKDVLKFEQLVELDSFLPNVTAAATGVGVAAEALGGVKATVAERVLQGHMNVRAAVDEVLALAQIPSAPESGGSPTVYYGTGATQVEGTKSLTELLFRHPFSATDTVRVLLEMSKASGQWRVVGVRGLQPLLEEWRGAESRAALIGLHSTLKIFASQEEIYYAANYTYARNLTDISFEPREGVTINILAAGQHGWAATAVHTAVPTVRCAMWYWYNARPEAQPTTFGGATPANGKIACDEPKIDTAYAMAAGPSTQR